jgi:UDP-glucose 4-epimerase
MKILVLGATGFLGSALIESILCKKPGWDLRVLSRRNLNLNLKTHRVEIIQGDIKSIDIVNLLSGVDHVIYLISSSLPGKSDLFLVDDVQNEVYGLLKILQVINRDNQRIGLSYISSGGAIYGNSTELILREEHSLQPVSLYGAIKVCAESFINVYSKTYGVKAAIIRAANIYGPGQRTDGAQGLISHFCFQAINNRNVTIFGQGESIRDYIYIDDFCNGIIDLIEKNIVGCFNLSSGLGYSVSEIVKMIEKISGKHLDIIHKPSRACDPKRIILDNSKFSEQLGWSCQVGIEEGIGLTYQSLLDRLKQAA